MKKLSTLLLFSVILLSLNGQELQLAVPFSNKMVLQRNTPITVWGVSTSNTTINLQVINNKNTIIAKAKTVSDKEGKWKTFLPKLPVGTGNMLIVFTNTNKIELSDIAIGEVWIAGGQSNMAFRLNQTLDAEKHITSANDNNIRFLLVPQISYKGQPTRQKWEWNPATRDYVGEMSAIGYFFAKKLAETLHCPIGIICDYKGGTPAEAWMSKEAIESNTEFKPILDNYNKIVASYEGKYEELYNNYTEKNILYKRALKMGDSTGIAPEEPMGPKHYKRPVGLYETMILPIVPFTVKGVIWYQGEANAPRAEQYQKLFPALIEEWRVNFMNSTLPFYFVQLSNYNHPKYGDNPNWAELREAQLMTSEKVKNTGMVVSIDYGEKNDIHPKAKAPIGERLAAIALAKTYKMRISYSGPIYKSYKIQEDKIILLFNNIGKKFAQNDSLKGFEICTKDEIFIPAKAIIKGKNIIVSSDEIKQPVAVRYGWKNWTDANLYNKNGLPASPFRTDNFDLITKGKR